MEDTLNYLVLPVLLIVAVVAVVLGGRRTQRRVRNIVELASRLGFRYSRKGDFGFGAKFGHFERFRRGRRWKGSNTMRGRVMISGRSCRVQMGDCSFRLDSDDNQLQERKLSYLLFQQPCGNTPDMCIRAEGLADKLASAVGVGDIKFESAEFNQRFHVTCPDKRFAYALITPPMMEHLLGSASATLESGRCWWLVFDGFQLWNAAGFEQRLGWMTEFFSRWPQYLIDDFGPQPERLTGFLYREL